MRGSVRIFSACLSALVLCGCYIADRAVIPRDSLVYPYPNSTRFQFFGWNEKTRHWDDTQPAWDDKTNSYSKRSQTYYRLWRENDHYVDHEEGSDGAYDRRFIFAALSDMPGYYLLQGIADPPNHIEIEAVKIEDGTIYQYAIICGEDESGNDGADDDDSIDDTGPTDCNVSSLSEIEADLRARIAKHQHPSAKYVLSP